MAAHVTGAGSHRRNRQQIPLKIPLSVSSLDPDSAFSETCETVAISARGCLLRAPRGFEIGTLLQLSMPQTERTARACVVSSKQEALNGNLWKVEIELEEGQKFWGVQFPPEGSATGIRAGEERARKGSSPPPVAPARAAAPARPTAAPVTPPRSAPRSSASHGVNESGGSVHEKTKGLSAKLGKSPRESLENVLMRLRADLKEPAPGGREGSPDEATNSLLKINRQVQPSRPGAADQDAKLPEVAAQVRRLGAPLQQQFAQESAKLSNQIHEELRKVVSETREHLSQERERNAQATAQIQLQLDEMRQLRDSVDSMARHLPQNIEEGVEAGVAQLEQVQARIEAELSTQNEKQQERLDHSLLGLADQVGRDLRQRLEENVAEHDRKAFGYIKGCLEEAHAAEGNLRQFASQINSELAQHSEQLRDGLQAQLKVQFPQRLEKATANLNEHIGKLSQEAEAALRALGEQTWNTLQQRLQADLEQCRQELRQGLETAQSETVGFLDDQAEKLATNLNTRLEERLRQLLPDTVEHIHEEFERMAETSRKDFVQKLQGEVDQTLTPWIRRVEAAAGDARELLDSLQEQQTRVETQSADHQRQVQAWLDQETQQFQRLVQDAQVKATNQTKERTQQALDTAQEMVAGRACELKAELEELVSYHSGEMTHQLKEQTQQSVCALQAEAQGAVSRLLEAHLAEVLERLEQQADELVRKSATQLQNSLPDVLESLSRTMREKLIPPSS